MRNFIKKNSVRTFTRGENVCDVSKADLYVGHLSSGLKNAYEL